MNKTVYLLIEQDFNQPTFMGFMEGQRTEERIVGKTFSLKKAEAFAGKSPLNTYRTV